MSAAPILVPAPPYVLQQFATREEWLDARRSAITATDAAAVLGRSPWRTALHVYADKLGLRDDLDETERMEWGRRLEPVIAAAYRERTGRAVDLAPPHALARSTSREWMAASLDARQGSRELGEGVLEIKCAEWDDTWEHEAPLHYQIQLQHQLAVTGRTWGTLVVLLRGNRLLWHDVERNDRFCSLLIEREAELWDRIQRHDPPAPEPTHLGFEAVKVLYPTATAGSSIELGHEAEALAEEWELAKAAVKEAVERKDGLEAQIRALLGDAEKASLPSCAVLTCKETKRAGYTVEPTSYRTLRLSRPKAR